MGNRVFNFAVETKPTGTTQLKTKEARFGDNYAQFAGVGLNGKQTDWQVSVDNDYAYIQQVKTFIDEHHGYESFLWTPPGSAVQNRYICRGYTENPHVGSQNRLTMTLEQVFFP